MRTCHILGIAIFCGAMGTLEGQSVQAQTPNSARFVKLLLLNQSTQIKADTKAMATRNKDIAKLDAATNPRQIKQLAKMVSRLNNQILLLTTKLQILSLQVYASAVNLTPSNPALVSSALSNLVLVQTLSLTEGLGVSPATPSQ